MRIETVLSAKALWWMDMLSLNPRGRNLYKIIGPRLTNWYGFSTPTEFDESKGVDYVGGEFSPSGKDGDDTGVLFTVYGDGIIVSTSTTTDDADLFLSRTLERLEQEGVIKYHPAMVKKKRYSTEFVVHPERPIKLLEALGGLYRLLGEIVYPGSDGSGEFSLTSLAFDVDPSFPRRQIPFTFQRRAGVEFHEELYYSQGPFTNEQHERVLNELEKALAA